MYRRNQYQTFVCHNFRINKLHVILNSGAISIPAAFLTTLARLEPIVSKLNAFRCKISASYSPDEPRYQDIRIAACPGTAADT
jgi:hypothetical protein